MGTIEVRVEMGILARQGKAIKAIARELNVSLSTLRQYLRNGTGKRQNCA